MIANPNPSNDAPEPEPRAGSARAPIWLFVLAAVLAFGGMGFLDRHGGGFDPLVYQPYKSRAELDIDQPMPGPDLFLRGRKVYDEIAKCVLCHLPTGRGSSIQFPPLAGSEWVLAKEPGRLIRIVLHGLQGPVPVNGQQFESSGMPPWKDTLNDEEIAAVITFIRTNPEWGNNASPVTPEQVKAIRDKTASQSGQFFVEDLLKVNENE